MIAAPCLLYLFLTFCLVAGTPSRRIIGGVPASVGEFPHQVSIRSEDGHYCGGAIINAAWVLTAGHCVDGYEISTLEIWAGFVDESNPGSGIQRTKVVKGICHEEYDEYLNEYDIGLFKVKDNFILGPHVNVINLPTDESIQYPDRASVSGWGATAENGPTSNILYRIEVNIFSVNKCKELYEDEFSELLICAGYLEGGKDACQGDSGGPMTCSINGKPVLCAVIATGQGCARPQLPGLYTPTSKYLTWIHDEMNSFI